MTLVHRICWLALFTHLACANPLEDAVNERPPVTRAALESHWQVDCGASWQHLSVVGARAPAGEKCPVPAGLRRQLELCAFIYQPPGEDMVTHCPDYGGAVRLLDPARLLGGCAPLLEFLAGQNECLDTLPSRSVPE